MMVDANPTFSQPKETKSSKKIWIYFLLILILTAAAIFVYKSSKSVSIEEQPVLGQPNFLDPNQIPEGFPVSFPIEAGAEILQSYNSETENQTQATRKFVSKKTLKENFDFYKKYITDNDWTIVSESDDVLVKYLSSRKDSTSLSISMTADSLDASKNIVDVNFVLFSNPPPSSVVNPENKKTNE